MIFVKGILIILGITLLFFACRPKVKNSEHYQSVDVTTARDLLEKNSEIVLLDVRTPKEVAAGSIENALHIDVLNNNFVSEVNRLDKDKTYLVYCRSGGRSVTASKKMLAEGFTCVINMEGGYTQWSK